MDFIDLKTQQKRIKKALDANIGRVLAHGNYIMGPEINELELKLGAYVGARYAVSCASGTDALLMALMALNVGPGDAVFTTPFTFVATAEVISLLGANPVFVDIERNTYNIDPARLEKAILAVKSNNPSIHCLPSTESNMKPKCVIPVDLFGLPADYDTINALAEKNNVAVIEDAAQAFGAEYNFRKACSFGNISCTSFFPAKPLGCYGDGGMCFTDDDKLASVLRSIRVHGQGSQKYENIRIGVNGRLDTLQAAILLAKFDIFQEEVEARQEVATRYTGLLKENASIIPPFVPSVCRSVWAQYSILAKDADHRTALQKKLQENKIPTAIYYPKPLHLQTAFASLGYKPGDFPISENISSRIFSIPMHPYLDAKSQESVAEVMIHAC